MDEANTEVIVIGGGLAGSAAACRAAALGCRVTLVEAAEDPSAGGNTAISGGGIHLTQLPLDTDADVLRDRARGQAWGHLRADLLDTLVGNASRARAWLVSNGVAFERDGKGRVDLIDAECFLAPKRDMTDVHSWPDHGPQRALRTLQSSLGKLGGEILAGAPVAELVEEAGGVTGIVTEDGRRIDGDVVLLADGGFQANLALRRRFIGPSADRMFLRGAVSGRGFGIGAAESVGAQLENTQWFYGHVMHKDVLSNDRLWPWPTLDHLLSGGGILVDVRGQRMTDEGRGGIAIANALGTSDDPAGAFAIVDATLWQEAAAGAQPVPANPGLEERGGSMFRADSVVALARAAGIDRDGLEGTLAAYNTAIEAGRGGALPIPRTGSSRPLVRDLVAFPAVAGITYTMGGPRVDTGMRVLDRDERAIPGLYAAGSAAPGPTAGYIGGLATALTYGLVAGETMAGDVRARGIHSVRRGR